LENLDMKLLVTPDGRYAICVGSAEWLRRIHGNAAGQAKSDSMISVVDLSSFTIVKGARTYGFNLYEFQGVEQDRQGRIFISSLTPWQDGKGAFIPLEVPSLQPGPRCAYRYIPLKPGEPQHAVPVTVESCAQDLDGVSLDDYLGGTSSHPAETGFVCRDRRAEYCPQPDRFTPDRNFGLGVRTEGHDSLLGPWVETGATAILFSMRNHAEVGEVDLMRGDPLLQLACVNGWDYLLVLRAGADLTVYQLLDAP
jgi:hypothetical protein